MDVLTELLDAVKLGGDVFFRCAFSGPWVMDIGQKPVAEFHLIVEGSCCVSISGRAEPVMLHPGDIVLFPHGHAHVLLDAPETPQSAGYEIMPDMPENYGPVALNGSGPLLGMLCGYFSFDRQGHSALTHALPPFIHIQSEDVAEDFPWLLSTMQFIAHEPKHVRPGTTAVVSRLVAVLFIQILRAYIASSSQASGLLGAIANPRIGKALVAMHGEPGRAWTLGELAEHAGMSRSAFAAGFQSQVNQTPMQYLTEWRMHKARAMLESSRRSMGDIAEACGYQSESSFSKAFKKQFGSSPGAFRRGSSSGLESLESK